MPSQTQVSALETKTISTMTIEVESESNKIDLELATRRKELDDALSKVRKFSNIPQTFQLFDGSLHINISFPT